MNVAKEVWENLFDYIVKNELVIEKGIYIAIVIGQITIYAIILTFYQYIESFRQTNEKKYLGFDLIKFHVDKKSYIFKKVISTYLFEILFILEIVYKPLISIYGKMIPQRITAILSFIWYAYVVIFFVLFILGTFQCARCIPNVKTIVEKKRNVQTIECINKKFRKKSLMDSMTKRDIDLLRHDMQYLRFCISQDSDSEFCEEYTNLFRDIFYDYVKKKEQEITKLKKYNKKVKNQIAWEYNMNNECSILKLFLTGKFIDENKYFMHIIQNIHLRLLELNFVRALLDDKEVKIVFNDFFYNVNSLNCREWNYLTEELFEKSDIKDKKKLIDLLFDGFQSNNDLFKNYCETVLLQIMRQSLMRVFEGKCGQKDFKYVFERVSSIESINFEYSKMLYNEFISYDEIDAVDLVKLVDKRNCTFIFVCLVVYYSIYKFRFEWKKINIAILKELVKNGNKLKDECERINDIIKNQNSIDISHRYSEEMYTTLVDNLSKPITDEWLKEIYKQKRIDAFYLIVIKLCVFEQSYRSFSNGDGLDIKILFINEAVKHKEILNNENVRMMISTMRYNDFNTLKCWPENLHITLRTLLLLNLEIFDKLLEDKIDFLYYYCIGQYLLIKHSSENNISECKKDIIRRTYVSSNMSIQEYVDYINNECNICGVELNYVTKEKMKSCLMKII